ncbi:hypothetical protein [Nonomuraea maheshkhaliensis]
MHHDATNPLGKLYGLANAAVTDESLRDRLQRCIPPTWYGFGIFIEAWSATAEPTDEAAVSRLQAAARERTISLLPDRAEARMLFVADREHRFYHLMTHHGGEFDGQTHARWYPSGQQDAGDVATAVELLAAALTGLLHRKVSRA